MAEKNLRELPLNQIRESPSALRAVNKESEEFQNLVDSIKNVGVMNAIVVRELTDPDTNSKFYMLVDGLHRFTASKEAGQETIPANVLKNVTDAEVYERQIIANIQKVETKPVEYSKQLLRILSIDPTLTIIQLASRLSRSSQWLQERLGLLKLDAAIGKLVDEGKINVTNAANLAKLPVEEQVNFVDRAMTMPPAQFTPVVSTRAKEVRDAKRQGRTASDVKEFQPVPYLQKLSDIKAELANPSVAPVLIKDEKITDPSDGFVLALKWVLHLDNRSVELQQQKDEARKRDAEAAKKARQEEREKKKAEEAAMVAAGV